jgi:hypothetical protein
MFFKRDNPSPKNVLVLDFGAVSFAAYGTDEDSDDITTLGTDRGFVALLEFYSFPVGARVKLLAEGEFLGVAEKEITLGDAEVWAEISFGDAMVEADVVSDNHLLETLFISEAKIEQREN